MIEKARTFATEAHRGQKRKGSDVAYIVHPMRVAQILQQAGCSDTVICAGYLHDVVEDTPHTLTDIERAFNSEIMKIVAAHTEDKTKSWEERKRHTIDVVKSSAKEVKWMIIADKLDNLQSIKEDLDRHGDAIWERFNAGVEKQKWYNRSIAAVMETGLEEDEIPPFFFTYRKLVEQTFDQ